MKHLHAHPINILENTSKYLILLLLPLLRALATSIFVWSQDERWFYTWIAGAWFDLMILGIMLGLGIYQWFRYTFSFNDNGIYIQKGIFFLKKRYLAFAKLTAVSFELPWYYRPIKVVHLTADTDGGSSVHPDFSITIHQSIAERILSYSKEPFVQVNQIKRGYIPSNFYVAIFSLLTSNSITGVLYISTAISQVGNIFGQDIGERIVNNFTRIANILAFGLPPAAAILGYTILGCWLISFSINLVKHLRFSVSREGKVVEINAGIFSKRRFSIATERINSLTIRQSLMSKLFGFFSVFIHCTGYGKAKNELSVLMPSGEETELKTNLLMLIPEIPITSRQIKPKLVNLSRFLIPPFTGILCVIGGGLLGIHFLPIFSTTIICFMLIIGIPFVWWFIVKFYSFFFTGIGVSQDVITIFYTSGFRIMTSSLPKNKITKIETSQTLFQITTKCCDVTFYSYAEGQKKQKVVNMNLPEVKKLLNLTDFDLHLEPDKRFTLWKA